MIQDLREKLTANLEIEYWISVFYCLLYNFISQLKHSYTDKNHIKSLPQKIKNDTKNNRVRNEDHWIWKLPALSSRMVLDWVSCLSIERFACYTFLPKF